MKNIQSSILDVYNRYNFKPVRADGVYLYDEEGNKVLDFLAGVAVNILGYGNKIIEDAIIKQIHRGFYSQSNYFYNEDAEQLASKLVKIAGFVNQETYHPTGKVFFCNSGAEAIECSLKAVRKRYNVLCDREYNEIICMENAFHGRTIATISATQRKKLTKGFEPLLNGFKIAKMNDIKSVENLITEHTSAVMLETIQGEGGILPCEYDFLKRLRELCTYHKIGLILDEIQCGNGRSGSYFAFQDYHIKPDVIACAKGIAGGLPMGACIMNEEFASFFNKGSHGTTFGGNALCCSVANAVFNEITKSDFLKNVATIGELLKNKLFNVQRQFPEYIKEISGVGLMVGMKFYDIIDAQKLANLLICNGLAVAPAGFNSIRFLPPLIIKEEHIQEAIDILTDTLEELIVLERY